MVIFLCAKIFVVLLIFVVGVILFVYFSHEINLKYLLVLFINN
jgi:hypothetical protein